MPRRSKPKKPRMSRMDAAVDAMAPFGFPEEKVKKHVKQLLEVYGEEGWCFIEEYSYKELIEAMLRDVDDEINQLIKEKPPAEDESGNTTRNEELNTRINTELLHLSSSKLQRTNGTRKRLHCYGWIGSDDDDENYDDFIVLKSVYGVLGPTPDVPPSDVDKTRRKRRSRWDV